MPKVENVKNLKAFFLPQDPEGETDSTLEGTEFAGLKFSKTSAIPIDCRVTGFDAQPPTVGTREVEDIEDVDDWTKYETDKITPGTATLNVDRAIDVDGILERLEKLNVDSPYLGVFKIGKLTKKENGSRTYNVVYNAPAILTSDMGFAGTAKQKMSATLNFQVSGKPKRGSKTCAQTLTLSETNEITLAQTTS